MKIIGCEEFQTLLQKQAQSNWLRDLLPKPKPKPVETALQTMTRLLDDRFTLLCDLQVEGFRRSIPHVLVGPTGVFVILFSELRGVFRAHRDHWEIFDGRRKEYKNTRPNLVRQAVRYSQVIHEFLSSLDANIPVQAVLLFADPGIHVDMEKPDVRIVLADAVERLAVGIAQGEVVFERESVKKIIDYLRHSGRGQVEEDFVQETRDAFSFKEIPEEKHRQPSPLSKLPSEEPDLVTDIYRKMGLTRKQWVFLGILVIVNILVLSALVLLVYLSG